MDAVQDSARTSDQQPPAPESSTTGPFAEPSASRRASDAGIGGNGADSPPGSRVDDIARRASSIVEQAAGILEEEIAAGIVAARRAEERLLGQKTRDDEARALLQRFRKDAHEVVDLLIDLAGAGINLLGNLARDVVRLRPDLPDPANAERSAGAGTVPVLTVPRVLLPGESGQATLSVDNDGKLPIGPLAFGTAGLFNATGQVIPAASVTFEPAELSVRPGGSALLRVTVDIPADIPAGEYSGLLQSPQLPESRAVLSVHVGQS
jgi:hypothetical protein